MKKSFLLLCVASLMLMSLVGCGDSSKIPNNETTSSIVSSTDISTTTSQLTTKATATTTKATTTTTTTKATTTTTKATTTTTVKPTTTTAKLTTTTHVHSYTTKVVAPSCTEDGYTLFSCACGNSYQGEKEEKLGHDFSTLNCNGDPICTRCQEKIKKVDTHNYENGYCLDCGDLDESQFILNLPTLNQTYEVVTVENNKLNKMLYRVTNVAWYVHPKATSSYKPYDLHATISIFVEKRYIFDEDTDEWEELRGYGAVWDAFFESDWVHLIDSNGEHHIEINSSNYGTLGQVGSEFEMVFDWCDNDPGTYSLEFINGADADFENHL